MTTVFHKTGKPYYPFTPPLNGTIDELCSNPTHFKQLNGLAKGTSCNFTSNYSTNGCGSGFKPVLDCEFNNNSTTDTAVCCPENMFPYAYTTNYCSYLDQQGCYFIQSGQCPTGTDTIVDCNMCCPTGISNNMNFSSTTYDANTMSVIGDLWNKKFANLPTGTYTIGYQNTCVLPLTKNSQLPGFYQNIGAGDCGGNWEITNMTEWYEGKLQYPGTDLTYAPGGFTVYNIITGKYLSMSQDPYVSGIDVSLTTTPTVVAIYQNTDGTYRIMNAKNQIGNFVQIGNIGNPEDCLVVNNNSFSAQNWGSGNTGLPCGINQGSDNNTYKFTITPSSGTITQNIPAIIANGEYVIEIVNSSSFVAGAPTNTCILDTGIPGNDGGAVGLCGTVLPRFKLDPKYRWIVTNQGGSGIFSIQSKVTGMYIQPPTYDGSGNSIPINISNNYAAVHIFTNTDGTSVRITDGSNICVINDNGTLAGFNWNINTGECGTGPNSTLTNYKFNFMLAPAIIIPPVSVIAEGTYEISTFNAGTNNNQQIYDDQEHINYSKITNMLDFNGSSLNERRWIITPTVDSLGNNGYTIKNVKTNRYISMDSSNLANPTYYLDTSQYGWVNTGGGALPRFKTSPNSSVLYIYRNPNNTYSIQSIDAFCLTSVWEEVDHFCGLGGCQTIMGSGFNNQRGLQSASGVCGFTNNQNTMSFTLVLIPPPPSMPILSGSGGNCYFTWYNIDGSSENISAFTDWQSCTSAITAANANASYNGINPSSVNSLWEWFPFFNGDIKTIYDYGLNCLSVDNNHNVIPSQNCTIPQDCSSIPCVDIPGNDLLPYAFHWIITPDTNGSGNPTGKYTVQNQLTKEYLSIPTTASTANLKTTSIKTPIDIKLTYSSFANASVVANASQAYPGGNGSAEGRLQPMSYYMHFTNPNSASEICAYTDDINGVSASISWSTNTGPVSGSPSVPLAQQQQQQVYECGANPSTITDTNPDYSTPNTNYQFTVSNYCVNDYFTYMNNPLCFNSYGAL